MKKAIQICLVLFIAAQGTLLAQERFQPTWESLKNYQCLEWYPRNMYLKDTPEFNEYKLKGYVAKDLRFTVKDDNLFLICP